MANETDSPEPILRVNRVTKRFGAHVRPAVDDVSFELGRGRTLGLVGESGSGKSTLARAITGLVRPDRGTVQVNGHDVVGANRRELRVVRRDLQMVFQDPYSSLNPRMTVHQLLAEGLSVHRLFTSAAERRQRVVELLELVGLDAAHLERHPRSFSGGQRQRIAIARALSVAPTLLICDEPVSSLDVSVQAQVLNLFRDLQHQLNLSIVFIGHDLAVVRYLCERIAVMQAGRVVEIGDRDQIFGSPQHPYTLSLLDAVPIPDPAAQRHWRVGLLDRTEAP